jgi:disulfide oxidoreductase YuzD
MRNNILALTSSEINWLEAYFKASYDNIIPLEFLNYVDIDGNKNGTRSDGI